MAQEGLRGIVFDLDGTLVDSLATTFQAFNHGIVKCGGREHSPREILAFFGTGERKIFARIVGEERADEAHRAARGYLDAHMGEVPLHEGVPELLESLKSAAVPIAVFTGRGWSSTEAILRHHRVLDRFVTVVADDHVGSPKPSPEGLHLCLKRMQLQPAEVLFVGDMPADMRAAREAGAQGVAALWDVSAERALLEPHEPAHWAERPGQVLEIYGQRLVL
jgi:HAD superfamily hydrolase (TIGR01509 family)